MTIYIGENLYTLSSYIKLAHKAVEWYENQHGNEALDETVMRKGLDYLIEIYMNSLSI